MLSAVSQALAWVTCGFNPCAVAGALISQCPTGASRGLHVEGQKVESMWHS